jgi:hypothetical protein
MALGLLTMCDRHRLLKVDVVHHLLAVSPYLVERHLPHDASLVVDHAVSLDTCCRLE